MCSGSEFGVGAQLCSVGFRNSRHNSEDHRNSITNGKNPSNTSISYTDNRSYD